MARKIVWATGTTFAVALCSRHYLGLAGIGFVAGFFQWLAVRPAAKGRFAALTGFAWLAGVGFAVLVDTPASGVLVGLVVAYAQSGSLGRSRRLFLAWPAGAALCLGLVGYQGLVWPAALALGVATAFAAPPGRLAAEKLVYALLVVLAAGTAWSAILPKPVPLPQDVRVSVSGEEAATASGDGWTLTTLDGTPKASLFSPAGRATSRLPLVVFLQGHGWQSPRGFCKRRLAPEVARRGFHLLLVEKIGVEPTDERSPNPTRRFYEHDTRAWRGAATLAYVRLLRGRATALHLLAYGEGARVAATIAAEAQPKSAALLAGGADSIEREMRYIGLSLLRTGGTLVDAVNAVFIGRYAEAKVAEVLANPVWDKRYLGLSYNRWASYLRYEPLSDWSAAGVPILALNGVFDRNTPIESSRKLDALPFAERREFKDLDHDFRDRAGRDHMDTILAAALDWLLR